jgi:hypothetical protein
LRNFVAGNVGEFGDGNRTELDACGGGTGVDLISVVEAGGAGGEEAEVTVHRVLVQRDQEVEAVAHVGDGVGTGADGEEGVAASNDGLIGVIGVQMKATAAEDFCEDITGGGDALAGCTSDTNRERLPHKDLPVRAETRGPSASAQVTHLMSRDSTWFLKRQARDLEFIDWPVDLQVRSSNIIDCIQRFIALQPLQYRTRGNL